MRSFLICNIGFTTINFLINTVLTVSRKFRHILFSLSFISNFSNFLLWFLLDLLGYLGVLIFTCLYKCSSFPSVIDLPSFIIESGVIKSPMTVVELSKSSFDSVSFAQYILGLCCWVHVYSWYIFLVVFMSNNSFCFEIYFVFIFWNLTFVYPVFLWLLFVWCIFFYHFYF